MAKRPRAHRADGPTEQGLGGRAPAPRAMLARSGVRAPRERRCCMTGDPNEDRRGQMRDPAVADADARQRHHQECLQQQNHLGERAGHGTQRDGLAGVAGRFVERGGRGETERWGVGAAFCQVRKNMFKSAREEM